MSEYLLPMSGGQETRIVPGPIRGGACPPPREIVVIETRKVYDYCFQEDMIERCFFVAGLGTGATVTSCEITNVACNEILEREPVPDQEGMALVSIRVTLDISITVVPSPNASPITVTRSVAFPKRVVLCAPPGTHVTCDVRGTCICTVQPQVGAGTEPNICCTIQLCIVLKTTADVNILVPSFGMVVPKECQVASAFGGCPPMPPEPCPSVQGTLGTT